MSGRMSRSKGANAERALCMELRLKGYDARRVIRTRAVSGYDEDVVPDVEILVDGKVAYTFESKSRKKQFTTIYALYEKHRTGKVWRYTDSKTGRLVSIGEDFEEVKSASGAYFPLTMPACSREAASYAKILRLEGLLKGAQFLAVKDNYRNFLFIRFWAV